MRARVLLISSLLLLAACDESQRTELAVDGQPDTPSPDPCADLGDTPVTPPVLQAQRVCEGEETTVFCTNHCEGVRFAFNTAEGPFGDETSAVAVAGANTWYALVEGACLDLRAEVSFEADERVSDMAPVPMPLDSLTSGEAAQLTWEPSEPAPGGYEVEFYKGPGCMGAPIFVNATKGTELSTGVLEPDANTTYSWRVRASGNGLCEAGPWSECVSFEVALPCPMLPAPTLSTSDLCEGQEASVVCTEGCEGAEYALDAPEGPFSANASAPPPSPGAHVWYARARAGDCVGEVTAIDFVVEQAPSNEAPQIPEGAAPSGGEAPYEAVFQWRALEMPGEVTLEIFEGGSCEGPPAITVETTALSAVETLAPNTTTTYAWRVRATGGELCPAGPASPCETFTVEVLTCGPVTLDGGFGQGGTATYYTPGCEYDAQSFVMAEQADGQLLLGGHYYTQATGRTMTLLRISPEGTIDNDFGAGGFVSDLFDVPSSIYGLRALEDGRIVVSGERQGRLVVLRLLADGSLDMGFGEAGVFVHESVFVGFMTREHLAIDAAGGVLVAGHAGGDFKVVRLTDEGVLDVDFGEGGVATADLGVQDEATSVALQADGRLVVVGRTDADFGVARFMPDGTLDPDFGTQGTAVTEVSGRADPDIARGVAIQPDGGIVVVGCGACNFNYTADSDWGLVRYTAEGALDPTFGEGGVAFVDIPLDLVPGQGDSDGARDVVVMPDGALLVAGWTKFNSGAGRMLIARFSPEGGLDPCFDDDGFYPQMSWGIFGQSDVASDILISRGGQIYITGTVNPSAQGHKALMRLLP